MSGAEDPTTIPAGDTGGAKPLAGVRVVELCEVAAGPFCAMTLADLGADVIKIERPAGDVLRTWPPITDGYSENFASVNRNKRAITLDLKSEDGQRVARALLREADVLVENFRPGVLPSLGLGYDDLAPSNPGLLYCSISAFGQSGPRATEGGFDLTMQAMAGIMSITGEPGGAPVKCGLPLCDFVAGLYGALSITAALRERDATGRGAHIDVSMLGTSLAVAALQTSEYFGTGRDPEKRGSAHPRNAPYQAFRAADGYFGMAAGNNGLWQSVCEVVGRPELADDPRYGTPSSRAEHQDDLRATLEEIFATAPAAQWIEAFAAAGVPCSPINSYADALGDAQVEHMGWVQDLALPNGRQTRTFGPPVRFDGETTAIERPPPSLGEQNAAIVDRILADPDGFTWTSG